MWAQNQPVAKTVGTIKSIQADAITVTSESGGEITATLSAATKILRVPPGEKDLKNATPLQVQDLQAGDRVLVRGQATGPDHAIAALSVIVMKQSDVAARQQRDREDWQKRGVGGLVSQVDPANGVITISSEGMGAGKSIAVRTTGATVLRRYAPGSVKFDDAKPAPLDQIRIGDQLRARGAANTDSSEVDAAEVVSGSFRNIAGTIKAVDPASGTMTVQDVISKDAVVVKVSGDSQMKKLPAEVAQRIAMRLKGAAAAGKNSPPAGPSGASPDQSSRHAAGDNPAWHGTGGSGGGSGGGPPDLQRMLSHLPNSGLADMQKGDAVIIVATADAGNGSVTAITLLAGVEAILTSAPSRSASSLLSPWSLGGSAGEGEAAQ
jgi:hypothetical protein